MVKSNIFKRIAVLDQPAIQLTKGMVRILDLNGKILILMNI